LQSEHYLETIRLAPHRIVFEKTQYIVEHLVSGEFFEMPQPAVEAIESLAKGIPLNQIEQELLIKYPDEDINIVDFLAQLEDMGFLITEKEYSIYSENELDLKIEEYSTSKSSRIGKLFFRNQVMPVYAILFCANIVFFISNPGLFPQPRDLFPFDSMVLNIIVSMVVSVILLAIHEVGHVLAARAYGLKTNVRLGHRLILPVIETQMPSIWRLPRNSRNIPLLAGLIVDHTILFLSLVILSFVPSLSVIITGIFGLIVLQLIMMSIYQCMFFMKTDLYYILQNVTGSYNLLENTEGLLKEKIPFIRQKNTTVIYDKERNIVRGYAVIYIFGMLASGLILVFYVIPQLMYSFTISFDRLLLQTSLSLRLDAILFFAQFVIFAGVLLYSWSRKYKENLNST